MNYRDTLAMHTAEAVRKRIGRVKSQKELVVGMVSKPTRCLSCSVTSKWPLTEAGWLCGCGRVYPSKFYVIIPDRRHRP